MLFSEEMENAEEGTLYQRAGCRAELVIVRQPRPQDSCLHSRLCPSWPVPTLPPSDEGPSHTRKGENPAPPVGSGDGDPWAQGLCLLNLLVPQAQQSTWHKLNL